MTVLDVLAEWVELRSPALEALGIKVTTTWGPPDRNPQAAWVDFESLERSARLTLWSNGEADLVIGDFVKGEVLLEEHREISTDVGLEDAERTVKGWLT